VTLAARHVRFAWDGLPASWLPADPEIATVIDVLHLLLPAGERWFCRVLNQVAPLVEDPQLRADLAGFVRQEAWHAKSHADLLAHFAAHGVPTDAFTASIERLFAIGGDRPLIPGVSAARWLAARVAMIAAIEHYTSVLGTWVLQADALDRAGADPTMMALLRWHGAEEVEHRAVAFDAARAMGIGYVHGRLVYLAMVPIFVATWVRGVRYLARVRGQKPTWRGFVRAGRRGLVPTIGTMVRETLRYLDPRFHPSQLGSTEAALAYLHRAEAA
jgi:hypothetical protein